MAIGVNVTARNAYANSIKTLIDAGGVSGYIEIYTGTRPATGGAATTLLSSHTLSYPCGNVVGPKLTFSAIGSDMSAIGGGVPSWLRIYDSNGNQAVDGSAGGNGNDIVVVPNTIGSGNRVDINSLEMTLGDA